MSYLIQFREHGTDDFVTEFSIHDKASAIEHVDLIVSLDEIAEGRILDVETNDTVYSKKKEPP